MKLTESILNNINESENDLSNGLIDELESLLDKNNFDISVANNGYGMIMEITSKDNKVLFINIYDGKISMSNTDSDISPIYEEGWEYDTGTPSGNPIVGRPVMTISKELSNTNAQEVADIVNKSYSFVDDGEPNISINKNDKQAKYYKNAKLIDESYINQVADEKDRVAMENVSSELSDMLGYADIKENESGYQVGEFNLIFENNSNDKYEWYINNKDDIRISRIHTLSDNSYTELNNDNEFIEYLKQENIKFRISK